MHGMHEIFSKNCQKSRKNNCKDFKMCLVNKRTRNQCQYCRFEKCLAVGMNPELIQKKNAITKKFKNSNYCRDVLLIVFM